MAFLGSFLIDLGLLQLVATYFHLRGASLTGQLTGPGILIGVMILMAGVWLVVDQPVWLLIAYALIACLPVAVLLLLAGIVTNLGWDPMRHFLKERLDSGYRVDEVQIPVDMVHVAQDALNDQAMMPATFITPLGWRDSGGADCNGKAVLLVCGAGDTRHTFKWRLLDELLHEQIAVLTIDPPGHGQFQNVPMTTANAKSAVKTALNWLSMQPCVRNVGACGISFGANQIAWLAAQDERIKCVALISAPVSLNPLTRRVYLAEVAALFLRPRNLGLLRDGSLLTLLQEYRKLKSVWFGESLYQMIAAFDTKSAVRAIGARPVLLVHGAGDIAIPAQNAQILFESSLPVKDLMLIPQATHVSPVLYPREMRRLAQWFSGWLNYNHVDAQ